MNNRIWTAAAMSLMFAASAQAVPIHGKSAALQSGSVAEVPVAHVKVAESASRNVPTGNAFGQTGTSNHQGMQGNGNAYGFGQGGSSNGQSNGNGGVTPNLPVTIIPPLQGPVTLQIPGPEGETVAVSEPGTLSLLGLGLMGLGLVRRRRKIA